MISRVPGVLVVIVLMIMLTEDLVNVVNLVNVVVLGAPRGRGRHLVDTI